MRKPFAMGLVLAGCSGREASFALPGEELPDEWRAFDASCDAAGGAVQPGSQRFTVADPIDSITALLTTGNLTVVPREGPVEVQVTGWVPSQDDAVSVSGGALTLDYVDGAGNVTIWAPADLVSWDLRVCAGNLGFEQLAGTVAAEARLGNVDGSALQSDVLYAHNPRGNVRVSFDTAPAEVWLEGGIGNHVAEVPIDRCDCDLDVGQGNTDLQGTALDEGAATSLWARRDAGNITVSR